MAATTLPTSFVLQQPNLPSGPYLCPVEAAANEPSQVLKFDESEIFSPRVKFATEQSQTTGDATLVHIRSCYNNKYWVAVHDTNRPAGQQFRIAASADKPEEDGTNDACTLFRVSPGFQLQSIRWLSDGYVGVDENRTLVLKSTATTFSAVVDWEKLVVLPSQVTFRSEYQDGNYLKAYPAEFNAHIFESGLELDDPLVAYQLFPTAQGYYRIKSLHFGKFLRRDGANFVYPNGIWADAEDNNNDSDTLFEFSIIRDNVIALRNLGNNSFCGAEVSFPLLSARYPKITRETRLIIEERVLKREISNLEYHLPRSRIYQGQVIALADQTIDNGGSGTDLQQVITFSEAVETTTSWSDSTSVQGSASADLKLTIIPKIFEGKVTLSISAGYNTQWGGSTKTTTKIETKTKAVVPPFTSIRVSLLCSKATCDVPFSYTQTDLLLSGEKVTTFRDDGVFNGVNCYNFAVRAVDVDENGQELKPPKFERVEPAVKSLENITIN